MCIKSTNATVWVVVAICFLNAAYTKADPRRELVDKLISQLQSSDWQERMSAATGLGGAGEAARHPLPQLWNAKSDENEKVRRWAAKSIGKIYKSLKTDVPLEKLVQQIAKEPAPPKWNRIPPHDPDSQDIKHIGVAAGLRFEDSRITIDDEQTQERRSVLWPGLLVIRIPLPYARHSHARWVSKSFSAKHGGLQVKLTKDYVPQLWEEREIIASQSLQGRFAKLYLPKLPDDRKWLVIYDDLKNGFDLDRDGRADVTLRVAPNDYKSDHD